MMDWNGTVNFALDALGRITKVNDHNEKIASYVYDVVGNRTSIAYPDGTAATYAYDLLGRMTSLHDAEGQDTAYAYDAASRLVSMAYPDLNGAAPYGWRQTDYAYDAVGQLLTQTAQDPKRAPSKTIAHTYAYDSQGALNTDYSVLVLAQYLVAK